MHIVLAANAQADQPWVADATGVFASRTGATVAVLSVDELELERYAAAPRSVYLEQAEEAATAAVERLALHGVAATRTVLSGGALDRILEFADSQAADVVVVGASTRKAVTRRLLGSVPISLVEHSPRPVLVVPTPRELPPGA